jgi:hypothetical protein
MNEPRLTRLDLRSPLFYISSPGLAPFSYNADSAANGEAPAEDYLLGEQLFCFELDPAESLIIEPNRERFLGQLIFAATGPVGETGLACPPAGSDQVQGGIVRLAAGLYLFAQKREALDREACVDLAIEQQKDGLWERYKPQNRLYIRSLFEDGKPVTQIFRPILN